MVPDDPRSNNISFFVFAAVIAAGIEADRLLAVESAKQAKLLKSGFAGIKQAQSANEADKDFWLRTQVELDVVIPLVSHLRIDVTWFPPPAALRTH